MIEFFGLIVVGLAFLALYGAISNEFSPMSIFSGVIALFFGYIGLGMLGFWPIQLIAFFGVSLAIIRYGVAIVIGIFGGVSLYGAIWKFELRHNKFNWGVLGLGLLCLALFILFV